MSSIAWGNNRLDLVGLTYDGGYVHKAWTGDGWFPEDGWEDFSGHFFSKPALVSWGPGRVDIIGLSADTGALWHLYYQDGWSEWEDLGGGPFIGDPAATSWGPDRLDFWAIDSEGELNHLYWDGIKWSDWEQLGGEFTNTPKVVHWDVSKIDIVGKGQSDEKFHLKSFDGSKWNPNAQGWYELAGPFESEPELLAKNGTSKSMTSITFWSDQPLILCLDFLYIFGIDANDELRMQIWTGYDWQPGSTQTWPLGNISSSSDEGTLAKAQAQIALGSLEL